MVDFGYLKTESREIMFKLLTAFLTLAIAFVSAFAQNTNDKKPKTIGEITSSLQKIDGYIPLFYDDEKGKMYLEITRLNEEFLHQVSLPTGVGSNPIGLDRGQLGRTK